MMATLDEALKAQKKLARRLLFKRGVEWVGVHVCPDDSFLIEVGLSEGTKYRRKQFKGFPVMTTEASPAVML